MDFPRLVYKGPAIHMLVENFKEHAAALLAGWFHSVPEAIAGKHDERPDLSVTLFKELSGKMESFKASTQEEADMFIQADGWYATAEAATAAVIKAEWPATPADVEAKVGELANKKKGEILAYAARIGAAVPDEAAKVSDILSAIKDCLSAGA